MERLGVAGLELGVEGAGVAKGVFEVEVMIRADPGLTPESASCARECGEVDGR